MSQANCNKNDNRANYRKSHLAIAYEYSIRNASNCATAHIHQSWSNTIPCPSAKISFQINSSCPAKGQSSSPPRSLAVSWLWLCQKCIFNLEHTPHPLFFLPYLPTRPVPRISWLLFSSLVSSLCFNTPLHLSIDVRVFGYRIHTKMDSNSPARRPRAPTITVDTAADAGNDTGNAPVRSPLDFCCL